MWLKLSAHFSLPHLRVTCSWGGVEVPGLRQEGLMWTGLWCHRGGLVSLLHLFTSSLLTVHLSISIAIRAVAGTHYQVH